MNINELYTQIIQTLSSEIEQYTVQLFRHNLKDPDEPNARPDAIGTSVLIKNSTAYFLVSAAHVFHEENIKEIGIYVGRFLYVITGTLNYHEPNDKDHDPQKLDIAVFKLDYTSIDLLKNYYTFLAIEDLDLYHFSSSESRYLVLGYPEELTKPDKLKRTIRKKSMALLTFGIDFNNYGDYVDSNKTIILLGPQKNIKPTFDLNNAISDFSGISGCGVWHITNLTNDSVDYKLVAILTGDDEFKTIFYSTKINAFISVCELNKWFE